MPLPGERVLSADRQVRESRIGRSVEALMEEVYNSIKLGYTL